jgi:hypothetical protein
MGWGNHTGGSWSRCCTRGYIACNIGTRDATPAVATAATAATDAATAAATAAVTDAAASAAAAAAAVRADVTATTAWQSCGVLRDILCERQYA